VSMTASTNPAGVADSEVLLSVRDLRVTFQTSSGVAEAVRGVSFDLRRGETLAIVGESGSGKSVAAKSLMGLLPSNAMVTGGEAVFDGVDLLGLPASQMEDLRGRSISMVFQDPMTSLNPTMKLGSQITETLRRHRGMSRADADARALELLTLVGIPNAKERLRQYPHQLSGGMRQRVVIAIALACEPEILIADEPTTALDVTIQAQILELLSELQERFGMAVILITHDLGVVADVADRVTVMYAGTVLETGTVSEVFYGSRMPYTWGLMTSMPLPTADRGQELIPIPGTPPSPLDPPSGCPFNTRCAYAMEICVEEVPENFSFSDSHRAACWLNHPMAPDVESPVTIGGAR